MKIKKEENIRKVNYYSQAYLQKVSLKDIDLYQNMKKRETIKEINQ